MDLLNTAAFWGSYKGIVSINTTSVGATKRMVDVLETTVRFAERIRNATQSMLNDDERMVGVSPTVVLVNERIFFVTPRTVDAHESIRSIILTTLSASSPLGFASSPGVFVIVSMRRIDERTGSFNECIVSLTRRAAFAISRILSVLERIFLVIETTCSQSTTIAWATHSVVFGSETIRSFIQAIISVPNPIGFGTETDGQFFRKSP